MCSSAPPPDPGIGQAAQQDSQTAAQEEQLSQEQFDYQKQRDAQYDPYFQQIADQSLQQSSTDYAHQNEQWQQYQSIFEPNEQKVVADANNWDSEGNINKQRGGAATDFDLAYQQQQASAQRALASSGADAGSGRSMALTMDVNKALGRTAAENAATENTQMQAMQLRSQAANLGRGLPATSLASGQVGNQTAGAGVGALGAQQGLHDAGYGLGFQGMSGAVGGYGSAANILQQQWGTQAGLTMQQNQQTGQLVGEVATLAAAYFF